jgi:micrococcal nuclease
MEVFPNRHMSDFMQSEASLRKFVTVTTTIVLIAMAASIGGSMMAGKTGLVPSNQSGTPGASTSGSPSTKSGQDSILPTNPAFQGTDEATQKVYSVVHVVDGDTVDVDIDGNTRRLRLIGIDTPETVDPRKPVQCFGKEASNRAKELLTGKKVSLEADASQGDTDTYGRLLRYVYIDGQSFNKKMIADGFAFEYTYKIPYKYQTEFKQAQQDARVQNKGLWSPSACNGKATPVSQAAPPAQANKPSTTPTPPSKVASARVECNPNYSGCVPNVDVDLDCKDIGHPVKILGIDVFNLDGKDKDGLGCENYK